MFETKGKMTKILETDDRIIWRLVEKVVNTVNNFDKKVRKTPNDIKNKMYKKVEIRTFMMKYLTYNILRERNVA